jgi:hypothetical protein
MAGQLTPEIESRINSKIELMSKNFTREANAIENKQVAIGMWSTPQHAQLLYDLTIVYLKTFYDEISLILLNEVRKNNMLTLKQVIDILDPLIRKVKEEYAKEILKKIKNDKDAYNKLGFDNNFEHELKLKIGDLQIKYQEIQDALETRKAAIWANRGAWCSVIVTLIIGAFTLLINLKK